MSDGNWQGAVIWEPDTVAAALLELAGGSAEISQDHMLELSTAIREGRLVVVTSGGPDGIWRTRLAYPGDPDVPEGAFQPVPQRRSRWKRRRDG